MWQSMRWRLTALALWSIWLAGASGCSPSGLQGVVTDGNTPLKSGQITFLPDPGTPGGSAAAAIVEGRYALKRDESLPSGLYTVRIDADGVAATNDDSPLEAKKSGGGLSRRFQVRQQISSEDTQLDFSLQTMERL
jgi:hypothetical protein